MAGQGGAVIERQISVGVEAQGRQAGGVDDVGLADCGQRGLGLCGVIGGRLKPGEAEDGGAVGGMADAGKGKAAMQGGAQPVGSGTGWRAQVSRNRAAATIGPMVWEDDGPMPTLNMSKTERNMGVRAFGSGRGW